MTIDELTWRVIDWVERYRFTKDPGVVLCAEAGEDAAALWRAVRAVDHATASKLLKAQFAKASVALGWLHYWRYRESPTEPGRAELARSLLCLEPVSDDYHAVPSELNPLIGRFTELDAQANMAVTLVNASTGNDDPALLDAAILLMTPVAALPRTDLGHGARLSHLCLAYRRRHERGGVTADLHRAIEAGEKAVAIATAHGVPAVASWSNLAFAYRCRHRLRADPDDLWRMIDLLERSFALTSSDAALLSDLATTYRQLCEHTGDLTHIEQAVTLAERATAMSGDQDGLATLATLATCLLRRYERTGARPDLWRAAELGDLIVAALPPDAPDRAVHLAAAASVRLRRHERSRELDDLHCAVDLYEQALSVLPDEDKRRPELLCGLATALHERYLNAGDDSDLDRAVTLAGWALAAIPDDHPDRARASIELAAVHLTRHAHTGVLADLARAIDLGEQVAAHTTPCPPEWLSTLSSAYQQRYPVKGEVADLDRAIHLGEEAIAATAADDFALAERQATLATGHWRRYKHTANRSNLDRAIELGEQAIAGTPDDHVDQPARLSSLAEARLDRYRLDRNATDVAAAIELGERALASTPLDHPGWSLLSANLCAAYLEHVVGGARAPEPERLNQMAAGVTEAQAATSVDRVSAHHALGLLAQASGEHRLAVSMLDTAVTLLPSVAPREAGWADQQHRIGQRVGLVGAAVAAHCAVGDPAGAVEIAELGRGLLLASQANTRVDLVELKNRDPRLADRFRWACERLNTADFPAEERRRWWADYDTLLTDIRGLPGLADFLATPRLADLQPAFGGGYGVLVNASQYRSDAVVVPPDAEPFIIELPRLRLTDVDANVAALVARDDGERPLTSMARRRRVAPDVLSWLWETVVGPIIDALPARDREPHRVWWLPTGLLGLLPLHAAGHPATRGALDAAVSSYVPSLRALQTARDRAPATRRASLTVALSHTPGPLHLPFAADEATLLGGSTLIDEQATADRVMSAITQATWAHFACHGVVDPTSQADSGLRLYDRTLRLPEVGGLRLAEGELAYLSACSTANHGIRYADEVLHLASAFHLAGFRHVVACLWPLVDNIAIEAARMFYRQLPDTPVAVDAAITLRGVTLHLRDEYPQRPDLWAPLVHSGP